MFGWTGQIFAGVPATVTLTLTECAVFIGFGTLLLVLLSRSNRQIHKKALHLRLKNTELEGYRRAVEAHAMVNIADADGRMTYINDTLASATGYSASDLVGQRFRDTLLAERTEETDLMPATIRAGKIWSGDTRMRRRDGSSMWARSTIVPVLNKAGKVIHTIAMRTDVTASRLLEAELQDRAMIDRLQDQVYVFTVDTLELLYLNKRSLESMNWTAADVRGKTLHHVSDPFNEAVFRDRVVPLLSGAVDFILYESDTHGVPIEVNLQLELAPDGSRRFVAVVRDISKRRRAELAKAEFVSTVSHELRSPLTSIKGSLNLIAAGTVGQMPAGAASLVNVALRNSDRLMRLINNLLDLEKLDANMMNFSFETVDIAAFSDEVVAANAGFGHEYGVTLRRVGGAGPVCASISRDGMMQVLTNLISNAVKFTPEGQSVDVNVSSQAGSVRISVTDRGPGIAPEAQARLFRRFTQVHDQADQRRNGTGLGLCIAKSIVKKHAGRIGFVSAPGTGSTFYVELPSVTALQAAA